MAITYIPADHKFQRQLIAPNLHISKCIELNVKQLVVSRSNNSVVFATILLTPSNLNTDSMAPVKRPALLAARSAADYPS